MATKIHTNKKFIIIVLAVAVAIGVIWFVGYNSPDAQRKRNDKTAQENHAKNDSSADNNGGSEKDVTSNDSKSNSAEGTMPTPVLIKSSGNNGAVPSGSNLEFICQSSSGYSCAIILTNKANSSASINLGTKKISGNQTDTPGAMWYWTAIKGSWSVGARLTGGSGQHSDSPPQTLEVQ